MDQAANNWYNQTYGYDQQRLANMGQALNSVQGAFQGQQTTGLNPAYRGRTGGGALASGLGGAATGAALGSVVPGIGTAAGAIGGGAIGLLGYYL